MSKKQYSWEHRKHWPSIATKRSKLRLLPGEFRVSSHKSPWGQLAVRTQADVARILGCTRSNVYEAERMAFHKIRNALKEHVRK